MSEKIEFYSGAIRNQQQDGLEKEIGDAGTISQEEFMPCSIKEKVIEHTTGRP